MCTIQMMDLSCPCFDKIEDITWPRGNTNFIFECWNYLSLVSEANEWEILLAQEDIFVSPSSHVMFCLLYTCRCWWNVQIKNNYLFNPFLKWKKSGHQQFWKINHYNVRLSHKNVNVVVKNYITARKYFTRKGKLAFSWLIMLVAMTTAMSSHVKDEIISSLYTVRIQLFFRKKEHPPYAKYTVSQKFM